MRLGLIRGEGSVRSWKYLERLTGAGGKTTGSAAPAEFDAFRVEVAAAAIPGIVTGDSCRVNEETNSDTEGS